MKILSKKTMHRLYGFFVAYYGMITKGEVKIDIDEGAKIIDALADLACDVFGVELASTIPERWEKRKRVVRE